MYYNPTSQGSYFDIGMSFMANKPIFIINPPILDVCNPVGKYENFLQKYAYNMLNKPMELTEQLERRHEIGEASHIEYEWQGYNTDFFFDFGMAFCADKPIIITNLDALREDASKAEGKDFTKVLLALDTMARGGLYSSFNLSDY